MKRALPRGGFVTGLVVGLLIGLGIALAVALYVTQAPVPFINKLPQRTAEQDAAEAQRNRNWDPNAVLAGKNPARPVAASAASAPGAETPPPAGVAAPVATAPAVAVPRPAPNPAAILAGQAPAPAAAASGPTGFDYWVQTGAYARSEDAETQRARLGMLGQSARVLEREQAGRPVYRVRIGPFAARADAEDVQSQLTAAGFESNLVRVER
jgi:cell division protein FtsN